MGLDPALGVEMDNYYYSANSHAVLEAAFGRDALSDATELVNWQRAVKRPAELDPMRKAGVLTAHMHSVLREGFREARPKHELVAEVLAAGVAGPNRLAGDYPAIAPSPRRGWRPRPRTSPGTTGL